MLLETEWLVELLLSGCKSLVPLLGELSAPRSDGDAKRGRFDPNEWRFGESGVNSLSVVPLVFLRMRMGSFGCTYTMDGGSCVFRVRLRLENEPDKLSVSIAKSSWMAELSRRSKSLAADELEFLRDSTLGDLGPSFGEALLEPCADAASSFWSEIRDRIDRDDLAEFPVSVRVRGDPLGESLDGELPILCVRYWANPFFWQF